MPITNKEKREENKKARKDKRTQKLSTQIKQETDAAGITSSKPLTTPGPLDDVKKAEIDRKLSDFAKDDAKAGLKKFQNIYTRPTDGNPKPPSQDALLRSARRQRNARFGDILTGLARGYKGQSVDASQFRGSKIKSDRDALYQQYKNASKLAKDKSAQWDAGYVQKQLDYLNGLKKDNGMSDLKKQKIQAEIDRIKVATKWQKNKPYRKNASSKSSKTAPIYTHKTKENNWQMTNQGTPYSDLYYKLAVNSPVIVNEVAKLSGHAVDETGSLKRNLSTAEVERFSNLLLSKAFEFKVDENGNQVAVPRPGKEAFMQDLSSFMDKTNTFRAKIKDLNEQRDDELYKVNNTWGIGDDNDKAEINAKYDGLVADIQSQLTSSESELKSMINEESITVNEALEMRKSGEWEMIKDKAGDAYLRNKSNHKELKKISK